MSFITVFTPTYNRAYILPKLYKSLLNQTNKDFIWLIVDDGSTDNTEEVVDLWKKEQKIDIRYFKQENKGKHIAHNKGVFLCETPLFMCVDSDDFITNTAIEIIYELYITEENLVLGFCFQKGDVNGLSHGRNWPHNLSYAFFSEIYQLYNYIGETLIVLKTDLIKKYEFPLVKGEKFMPENALYDCINHIAPMKLDNRICYCFEYIEDGYTNSGMTLYFNNPIGVAYAYITHVKFSLSFKEKLKGMAKYLAWVDITQIDMPEKMKLNVPFYLYCLGHIFKKHYVELFNKKRSN